MTDGLVKIPQAGTGFDTETRFDAWSEKAHANAILMRALEDVLPEFDLNHLKGGGRFDEKALCSIDIASLVCSIEDLLHCTISHDEYQHFYTIEGARRVIAQKLRPARGNPLRFGSARPRWRTLLHHVTSRFHTPSHLNSAP